MDRRPVSFVNLLDRVRATEDDPSLSLREKDRRKMISRLEYGSLQEMLQDFRAKYYCRQSLSTPGDFSSTEGAGGFGISGLGMLGNPQTFQTGHVDKDALDKTAKELLLKALKQNPKSPEAQVELTGPPPLRFDHRVDTIMQPPTQPKYPSIPPSEQEHCRALIANFVYAGDQFLYARTENPVFDYKAFDMKMRQSQKGVEKIQREAKRGKRAVEGADKRVAGKLSRVRSAMSAPPVPSQLSALLNRNEQIRGEVAEQAYRVEKAAAENDHSTKANKLLNEKLSQLRSSILDMHTLIKEAQESYVDLSPDHINLFDGPDKMLLLKKIDNLEKLLDKGVEAGQKVQGLLEGVGAYNTRALPYSYAQPPVTKPSVPSQTPPPGKPTNLILTERQKRDRLVDDIFEEMRRAQKLPRYSLSSLDRVQKLKLIRDHFESLYKH